MHQNDCMDTELGRYFAELTNGASFRQMGARSGINHSTIRRQLIGEGEPTATLVVGLARAYKGNVLDALVAAGFITEEEAGSPNLAAALRDATDLELAQEIVNRTTAGSATETLTDPIKIDDQSNVIVGGFGKNVDVEIPENVEEEWAGQYAADPAGDDPIDNGTP